MRIQTYRDESLSRHFDLIYGGARQYRAQSLANFTAQQLSDLLPSEMVTTTALMTGAKYPAFCPSPRRSAKRGDARRRQHRLEQASATAIDAAGQIVSVGLVAERRGPTAVGDTGELRGGVVSIDSVDVARFMPPLSPMGSSEMTHPSPDCSIGCDSSSAR